MKELSYDVIVAGGGPQGIAAALAAADGGARTLLIEESLGLGGALGPGLLGEWRGDVVLAGELLGRISRRAWGRHIYEPEDYAQAARAMLESHGIQVMPGSRPIKLRGKGTRLRELVVSTPVGRCKLTAWCFVDGTDDWTLARLAGCAPRSAADLRIGLRARIGGIDTRTPGVFHTDHLLQYEELLKMGQSREEYPDGLPFPSLTPCLRGGTAILDAQPYGLPVGDGVIGWAEALQRCRAYTLAALSFLQHCVPGYENCHLIHYAASPVVRHTAEPHRRSPPGESRGTAMDDLPVLRWSVDEEESQTIVLGHLLCRSVENLVLARGEDMEPTDATALTSCGLVVGLAASLSVLYDGHLSKLDPERLQRTLALREDTENLRREV